MTNEEREREKERFYTSHHPSLIGKREKEEESFRTKKNPRNVILFIIDSNTLDYITTSLKLCSVRHSYIKSR